jgi:MFS family permease
LISEAKEPAVEKKHKILSAMIISMVLGYMPWYNFSAALNYIADEFGLTANDTGVILGSFQTGYVLVVGITGWLGDKFSLKKIVFFATLITGVFSLLFIWGAQGISSIIVFRLITGLAAGAIYVPGMSLLSRWLRSEERGAAFGAYTGALTAAYAGGYLVAGYLSSYFGWRTGIFWTSIPAIIAAFVIFFFVSDRSLHDEKSEEEASHKSKANGDSSATDNGRYAHSIKTAPEGGYAGPVLICISYIGHMWELYAFWGWIGPFILSSALAKGMTADNAVLWSAAISSGIILLGAPASWAWGIFADKKGRTFAIILAGLFSVTGEFIIGYLHGQSLILIAGVGAWIGFWIIADSAVYKAGLTEMVDPKMRGTCLGVQSVVGFSVTIVSPIVFGRILQSYNEVVTPAAMNTWSPAFLALGFGGLISPITSMVLRRHRQSILMAKGRH